MHVEISLKAWGRWEHPGKKLERRRKTVDPGHSQIKVIRKEEDPAKKKKKKKDLKGGPLRWKEKPVIAVLQKNTAQNISRRMEWWTTANTI